ncbi:MAG TPA: penicillin-insensitive murein endopeptidase [Vicinamibacteria bacterium]
MRESRPTTGRWLGALLALAAAAAPLAADERDAPPVERPARDEVAAVEEAAAVDGAVAVAETALPDLPSIEAPSPDTDTEALLFVAQSAPAALGPLSIGTPDAGLLLNPVPFASGSLWTVRDPDEAWATDETIDAIVTAIEAVEARYPGSPRLVIGDLSHPGGGRLNRHKSHQTGRDADIGFYYRRGEVDTFLSARRKDLDLPRTWALVRALVTETDVDRIFVDRSLISILYAHAVAEGEDRAWLNDVFGRTSEKGIIQHERRHKDHLHVRFFNARAQERGRIVYPVLVETGAAPPPMVRHRVRPGETLGALARRYGTSVSAIKSANGLRTTRLRAGRSYTIPIRRVPPDVGPVLVPPRRLPPELQARASVPPPPAAAPEEGVSAALQR